MQQLATKLEGPILIEPEVHGDERGFFLETYRKTRYAELGIHDEFVQDNHSRSRHGVVRGMHFQLGRGMSKLVRCARGAILDVVVDVRRGSPAFGHWEAVELNDDNHLQLYCPIGFAHGFCVLSEMADVVYLTDDYYDAGLDSGFSFDDPEVGIDWPEGIGLIPSLRDQEAPLLREIEPDLPFGYRE
jgi:dTDP-4-dehydrorhamnose 3,5-epimerase